MAEFGALIVDELFYLEATRALADLEDGDAAFDIWTALDAFLDRGHFESRLRLELGRELDTERGTARLMVAAIYIPTHYDEPYEQFLGEMDDLDQETADYVRSATWSFLTAWTHRYGGMHQRLHTGWTLVDPRERDPKTK